MQTPDRSDFREQRSVGAMGLLIRAGIVALTLVLVALWFGWDRKRVKKADPGRGRVDRS